MKLATLVSIGFVLLATPALAHDAKPLNGGRLVQVGNFHIELVAKDDTVSVYLIDHNNNQMPLAGYNGVAILSVDGKSQRIVLEAAGDARLAGKAAVALPAQPKGVVQITPPAGKTVQGKFN
jgi:hypothetical protein